MRYTKVRVELIFISDDNIEHATAFEYAPDPLDLLLQMAIKKRTELVGEEPTPGEPFF